MLSKSSLSLIASMVTFAALFFVPAASANAQFEERIKIRPAAVRPSTTTTVIRRPSAQKVTTKVVVRPEFVVVSNLFVNTEPGAMVLVQPLAAGAKPISRPADGAGSAIFENIRPGSYKVTASKEGFVTAEADDVIKIVAKKNSAVDLGLTAVTYDVRVETNLTEGEVRFAKARKQTENTEGRVLAEELGQQCFVRILRKGDKGEAVISDLPKGYYNLDIVPTDLKYERTKVGIDVAERAEQADANGVITYEVPVDLQISTQNFQGAWTRETWQLPAGWTLDNRMRIRNSAGTFAALPQNDLYRYYANFQLDTDVRLADGGTVGFALRALDDKNYYLIQISGANAPVRNVITGYIVRNGVPTQFFAPLSISGAASAIASRRGFHVTIKGMDERFGVWIEDSESGNRTQLTEIRDPAKTFRKGAVGIAATGPTSFEVTSFLVCSSECK